MGFWDAIETLFFDTDEACAGARNRVREARRLRERIRGCANNIQGEARW